MPIIDIEERNPDTDWCTFEDYLSYMVNSPLSDREKRNSWNEFVAEKAQEITMEVEKFISRTRIRTQRTMD